MVSVVGEDILNCGGDSDFACDIPDGAEMYLDFLCPRYWVDGIDYTVEDVLGANSVYVTEDGLVPYLDPEFDMVELLGVARTKMMDMNASVILEFYFETGFGGTALICMRNDNPSGDFVEEDGFLVTASNGGFPIKPRPWIREWGQDFVNFREMDNTYGALEPTGVFKLGYTRTPDKLVYTLDGGVPDDVVAAGSTTGWTQDGFTQVALGSDRSAGFVANVIIRKLTWYPPFDDNNMLSTLTEPD